MPGVSIILFIIRKNVEIILLARKPFFSKDQQEQMSSRAITTDIEVPLLILEKDLAIFNNRSIRIFLTFP